MNRPMKSHYSQIHAALILFLFAFSCILQSAENKPKNGEVIRLWKTTPPAPNLQLPPEKDTTKPGDNLVAERRVIRTGNVSTPTLTVHRPEQSNPTELPLSFAPVVDITF
jgi:hypothetical protein